MSSEIERKKKISRYDQIDKDKGIKVNKEEQR